jgi:hypothetical protein
MQLKITNDINKKLNVIFSDHSKNLRRKINKICDYEEEFNKLFGDFVDKKLPRDDLYFEIKQEHDKK